MPVQLGFIGSGGIAGHHMSQLAQVKGVRMVAFCDADAARARARVEQYGGHAYTDYAKMLDAEALDGVFICTPPHVHGAIEEACIERGLPMFIEKPISSDFAVARKLAGKIAKSGLITAVGYHWRYMEATNAARKALAGKTIGMALGSWCGGFPMVPWWRKRRQGGGQNIEQTTHIFDLLRYLCGEVSSVQASYAKRVMHRVVKGCDVEDVGMVNLRLASGAVAGIANCSLARNWGCVELTVVTHDVVCEVEGNGAGRVIPASGEAIAITPPPTQAQRVTKAFVDAIRKRDPSGIRSSYADALKTLAITAAAEESAKTGALVKVPRV